MTIGDTLSIVRLACRVHPGRLRLLALGWAGAVVLVVFLGTIFQQVRSSGLPGWVVGLLIPVAFNLLVMAPTFVFLYAFKGMTLRWQTSDGQLCRRCAYDLRGLQGPICSECGHISTPRQPADGDSR